MSTKPTKQQQLFDLSMEIEACIRCPYHATRDAPLVGNGNYRSPILIIGPSVRKRDDEDGEVFEFEREEDKE